MRFSRGVRAAGLGFTHGVRWLRATREDRPSSRENATVSTATSMHCHSGGWLGIDAMAANAKIWNSEPAGRRRHHATTREQPHAITVVATTRTQVVPAAESPARASTRAGEGGQEHHQQHQPTAPDLQGQPPGVRLVAAVDPGEGAEGSEDCQIQAVQQHQRDQRNKDSHGAAEGNLVVLVARRDGEHLGEQLHSAGLTAKQALHGRVLTAFVHGFGAFRCSRSGTTAALASKSEFTPERCGGGIGIR